MIATLPLGLWLFVLALLLLMLLLLFLLCCCCVVAVDAVVVIVVVCVGTDAVDAASGLWPVGITIIVVIIII